MPVTTGSHFFDPCNTVTRQTLGVASQTVTEARKLTRKMKTDGTVPVFVKHLAL